MRRCHFQTSCSEIHINVCILDDWYFSVNQRNNHFLAVKVLVLLVLWVDTHSGITEYCLRSCCCDNCVSVLACDFVSKVVEFALLFLIYYFLVGKGSLGLWIPVYHSDAAVYQSLVVEVNKHLYHALGTFLVHGEACSVPVAACSEFLQLFQYYASVLSGPVPCVLKKLFSGQVCLFDALLCKLAHNLSFCGDGCVVSARNPASVLAHHSGSSHKYVLDGIVQHVSHVQHASHVWRRDNYCVRLSVVWLRMKESVVKPVLIPF